MEYRYTFLRSTEYGVWTPAKAKTLSGAKREAWRNYGASYLDGIIKVEQVFLAGACKVVATRKVIASKWEDVV